MTRKFRAWDKEQKCWIKIAALNLDEDGEMWYLAPVMDDFNPVYYENELGEAWELMQSTGLKDKNGVEIYEGDIVKCTVDNWSNGEKFEQIDKVVYEDCMFTFSDGFKYDCSITHPAYLNKEVIGNIYENPELMI